MRSVRWLSVGLAMAMVVALLGGLYRGARLLRDDPHGDPARLAQTTRQAGIDEHFRRGVALLDSRHFELATQSFHKVLALAPEMPEAHVNMGYALLGMGHFAAARDFFNGAIELHPRQVNAYYGLAFALAGLEDVPGALGAMRTYIHLSPADDPYLPKARAALEQWQAALDGRGPGRRPVPQNSQK